MREALAWYPDDVWLWLLACQWRRIDQEEPFVGRTAEVGDELGSRVLAARLVRDAMRLCFLLERRYAPYAKWLGSGFRRLHAYEELGPMLEAALVATDYLARERTLRRGARAAGAAAQRDGRHRAGRRGRRAVLRPPVPSPRLRPVRRRVSRAGRRTTACARSRSSARSTSGPTRRTCSPTRGRSRSSPRRTAPGSPTPRPAPAEAPELAPAYVGIHPMLGIVGGMAWFAAGIFVGWLISA